MNNSENQITEEFAKQLLRSLYKLDIPVGKLDLIASKNIEAKEKELLIEAIGEIMYISLNELMLPIYRCHPSLGRASEPGSWLNEAGES